MGANKGPGDDAGGVVKGTAEVDGVIEGVRLTWGEAEAPGLSVVVDVAPGVCKGCREGAEVGDVPVDVVIVEGDVAVAEVQADTSKRITISVIAASANLLSFIKIPP